MAWNYFFLDNGGREMKLSDGKTWRRTSREMHYCVTLEEAVIEAKQLTFGKQIEISRRYGFLPPIVVVEPDGSLHDNNGNPIRLYDRNGNRL